jgi:hypothetical protein
MADGHLNICKECTKKRVAIHRENNLEKIKEYDRNRPNKLERYELNKKYRQKNKEKIKEHKKKWRRKNREKTKEYQKKWRRKNREKVNAESKALRAIREGRLIKPEKCENCGTITKLEAHHPDYSQPLKVQFLCINCHKAEHKKINEKMRRNQ